MNRLFVLILTMHLPMSAKAGLSNSLVAIERQNRLISRRKIYKTGDCLKVGKRWMSGGYIYAFSYQFVLKERLFQMPRQAGQLSLRQKCCSREKPRSGERLLSNLNQLNYGLEGNVLIC